MEGPIMLDGDLSLRQRDSEALWDSFKQAGVEVSIGQGKERLPVILSGPWKEEQLKLGIDLDISRSSQPLSSWMLASASLPMKVELKLQGKGVSNRHSKLTAEMIQLTGGKVELNGSQCMLSPWIPSLQENYAVPGDASMTSFAFLATHCLDAEIELHGWPGAEQAIGHEILSDSAIECGIKWSGDILSCVGSKVPVTLDVTDSNDILPPLAALLSLGGGGKITGAAHAVHKESNRLSRTVEVLSYFGIQATVLADGIEVAGNQKPIMPHEPVPTFDDHRLFMTAVLLAAKTGGEVIGQTLHHVADEAFVQRLQEAGVGIEATKTPSLED
jgi:5-enolpyruvylshikimate-3-phosphate synthase